MEPITVRQFKVSGVDSLKVTLEGKIPQEYLPEIQIAGANKIKYNEGLSLYKDDIEVEGQTNKVKFKTINNESLVGEGNISIDISGKQDKINDLNQIRAGATLGNTAYQKPTSGIPASDLAEGVIPTNVSAFTNDAGYLTNHQSLVDYAKTADVNSLITSEKNAREAADTELSNNKQDKLIAGTNITISSDNVISATGSGASYTAGSGIEISNNVISNSGVTSVNGEAGDIMNIAKSSDLNTKQDLISDLETIRSGAAKGNTALQEVPNTYRKSVDQDAIDANKQDKLTAGANIGISNNVISAVDTTYSIATPDDPGLMSSVDKIKLDGITEGASAVSGTNDGTNWQTITIDGITKAIPTGGSGGGVTSLGGAVGAITLGSGLAMSNNELSATGSGGEPSAYLKSATLDGASRILTLTNKDNSTVIYNPNDCVYPETYGAVGDGTTDDSDAIQAALDYAFEHKIPTVLKNIYKVTKPLNVHGWCHIIGCDPNFDDYHALIKFFPATMGTKEEPTALFVNTDSAVLEGKHSFDNIKAVNKVGTWTAVFAFSCPIDHGSHVRNCRFSDFSIVFDCYILHVSYIDHNTFGGVQYAFTRRNITDSYICYNYISGYRPKAPYCFYGGYITHSEISHNFFDFWMGVFEYGMYTKFIDNIFDYCFMVFGYSDQPGRNNTTGIGKNIYECVIANNEFPNCAGCATSPDGFGSVRDTIATSEQGANKIILLDRMPVGSAIFIACYSGSTAEDFKLGGYYYTFSNSVTGNNFMGAGVFVACTNAGGFNFSGNKYVIKNGTYYLEDFTNAWFSIEYNSNTGNNHMPCHIDLFEMVPFKRLPNMNGASSNTHEGTGFPFAFALPHGLKLIYDHKQLTVDYISGSYVDALGNTVTAK